MRCACLTASMGRGGCECGMTRVAVHESGVVERKVDGMVSWIEAGSLLDLLGGQESIDRESRGGLKGYGEAMR